MSRTRAWVLVWLLPSTWTGSLSRRAALDPPSGRTLHWMDASGLEPDVAYHLRVILAGDPFASARASGQVPTRLEPVPPPGSASAPRWEAGR